jgi:hypothetical protein
MTTQATLPFAAGSVTSFEAAMALASRAGGQRARVLGWLILNGPATDREMQAGLIMDGSTQRPRRIELMRDGVIVALDEVTQANGRRATRWGVRG